MKHAILSVRAVLDTNVYLSGILFGGKPADVVASGLGGAYNIVSSMPILIELRDKLEERFGWKSSETIELLETIVPALEVVDVPGTLLAVPADPDDNPIVETAIVGKAAYIVTGDKHLLRLNRYQGIGIVTVDAFTSILSPPPFVY